MSSLSLLYHNTSSVIAVGAPFIEGFVHELAESYSSVSSTAPGIENNTSSGRRESRPNINSNGVDLVVA